MVENPFAAIGGQLTSQIFGGILWFGLAIIIIAVLGGLMWYFLIYKKKFDITVKIKSERSGEQKVYFDLAAILYDRKDKIKYFRLRDTRVDLPVPPFNVLQSTNKGDYLEIWRKSEDEFVFLTPGTIDRMNVIKQDGVLYPLANVEQKQIEGDIAYWNTKRKNKDKGLFDTESLLMKILPFIPQIIGGVFMIFILYILMNSLPDILANLKELTIELKSLKGAAVVTTG